MRLRTEIEKIKHSDWHRNYIFVGLSVNRRQTLFLKQTNKSLFDEKYITSIFAFFISLFLSTSVSILRWREIRHAQLWQNSR